MLLDKICGVTPRYILKKLHTSPLHISVLELYLLSKSALKCLLDLTFKMISLGDATILYELSCKADCVPTEIHVTEDKKYAVTNNVLRPEQGMVGLYSFVLDGSKDNPCPRIYEYLKGTKYPTYKPTGSTTFNI